MVAASRIVDATERILKEKYGKDAGSKETVVETYSIQGSDRCDISTLSIMPIEIARVPTVQVHADRVVVMTVEEWSQKFGSRWSCECTVQKAGGGSWSDGEGCGDGRWRMETPSGRGRSFVPAYPHMRFLPLLDAFIVYVHRGWEQADEPSAGPRIRLSGTCG